MERTAGFYALVIWAVIGLGHFSPVQGEEQIDNFALMIDSLKTFQVHACDDEELRIDCHPGTVISINFVRYGRPYGHSNDQCNTIAATSNSMNITKDCVSQNAFEVIERNCQEHQICRLMVSPATFHDDPCPQVRKFAEVAYRCRPYEFENRIACENEKMTLTCPSTHRILIYSATFGSTNVFVAECPGPLAPNKEICESSYAAEEAISRCHSRESCTLWATVKMFGQPESCSSPARKFLKVGYTCVPKEILVPTTTYPTWFRDLDYDSSFHIDSDISASTVFSVEMQQDSTSSPNKSREENRRVLEFLTMWLSLHKFVEENRQKLILYTSLSLSVGLIFFILVVVLHLYLENNLSEQQDKLSVPPITDDDFFSDSDLEHYEGEEFAPSAADTMMRKISETIPRAPVSDGPHTNHFFN